MALNIKNDEVERLAAEVARLTGESKTEAIRRALAERRQRLAYRISRETGKRRSRGFSNARSGREFQQTSSAAG